MDVMQQITPFASAAPVNIEGAVRALGISLVKNANLPEGIAGHIKRLPSGGFEIASTKADHYYRQRFTMAHELGHYVLHRSLIGSGVDDDTKYRSTAAGEFYNSMIDVYHERQANSFAANILMPEVLVRDLVGANPHFKLKDFATRFQVSPSAMRWQLKNLEIYSEALED